MRVAEPDPVVGTTRRVQARVAATPEQVYAWISDVEHLGGLGNECRACRWIEPGVLFEGVNKVADYQWETRCRVAVAEPGRRFGWEVPAEAPYMRWIFEIEPAGEGAVVTHAFEVLGRAPAFGALGPDELVPRFDWLEQGMRGTVEGVKRAVEAA